MLPLDSVPLPAGEGAGEGKSTPRGSGGESEGERGR